MERCMKYLEYPNNNNISKPQWYSLPFVPHFHANCLYIHRLDQTPQTPILYETEWNMNDSLVTEWLTDYILYIYAVLTFTRKWIHNCSKTSKVLTPNYYTVCLNITLDPTRPSSGLSYACKTMEETLIYVLCCLRYKIRCFTFRQVLNGQHVELPNYM